MKFEIFTPTVIYELGKRKNQEDSVFPAKGATADSDRLFLVCDGMGGHSKGEVASANVIDAMTAWIKQRTLPNGIVTDNIIEDALQSAHQRLDSLDDGAENKMGTTLTLVCLHRGGVLMGHVGDSRIYHIRPSQRQILYKSIDHSLVYELFRSGVISYDEMATSPQRNVITRAIMPGAENNDKIDIAHTTNVQPGDYFYLCSDGMLEVTSDDQLLDVLCSDSSDVMKASKLESMTAENKDNHTALLIKIKDVVAEPGDENLPNDEHISSFNEMATAVPVNAASSTTGNEAQPVAPTPVKPVAPPYAPARNTAAVKTDGAKKGMNKILLLLIILLLAIVIGCAVYILLNKDKGTRVDDEDSAEVSEMVEKSSNSAIDTETATDAIDGNLGNDVPYHREQSKSQPPKAPKIKEEKTTPKKPQSNNGDDRSRIIAPETQRKDNQNESKDLNLRDKIRQKPGQETNPKPDNNAKGEPSAEGKKIKLPL